MTEHHIRAHMIWSSSATSRNCVCSGAIAMSTLCEDVEREAAAWGSCAHQLSEKCLLSGPYGGEINADSFIGMVEKSGKFSFTVDNEMANTSQVYVDYCRQRLSAYKEEFGEEAEFWIEKRLTLEKLDPPLEAGGTGDFIAWFPRWSLLEITDLKGGRGVTVGVLGNPQGRSYGIGAILTLPDVKPTHVRVTIVQPRVGDGLPKSEDFHVVDLLDWTADLLVHMAKSKQALDEFEAIGAETIQRDIINTNAFGFKSPPANRILFDEWAEKWLTPGQCTFCQAKPVCPALRRKALAAMPEFARTWHEDVTLVTPPALSNLAKAGSAEELAHDLDGFDELEGWIKARRAYAHQQAEAGVKIPNYGLVDKIGNRAFIERDETKVAYALTAAFALSEDQIFEPRQVKSVAQIEKVLGKRKTELAKLEGKLWEKPRKGTNLVRLDRTDRPPAKSTAETFHEDVN